MSGAVEDTAAGATKTFLGFLGFILLMEGVILALEKVGLQLGVGLFVILLGALCLFSAVFWRTAKRILSAEAQRAIAHVARSRSTPPMLIGAFLIVLVLSPFVEHHRWPFSTVFHDPPTAEDIERAAAPRIAAAQAAAKDEIARAISGAERRIAEAERERDALKKTLATTPVGVEAPIWRDIDAQMHLLDSEILTRCDILLANWRQWTKDKNSILNISSMAVGGRGPALLTSYIDRIDALRVRNSDYVDLTQALNTEALRQLARSLTALHQQALTSSDESALVAFVENVSGAVRAVRARQSSTLAMAGKKDSHGQMTGIGTEAPIVRAQVRRRLVRTTSDIAQAKSLTLRASTTSPTSTAPSGGATAQPLPTCARREARAERVSPRAGPT